LFHGLKIGAEATMHCENLFVNDSSNGQAIEAICKCLPEFDVIASFAYMLSAEGRTRGYEGTNIHHKNRKCDLYWRIRDYRGE
jgi:hypothetical protein